MSIGAAVLTDNSIITTPSELVARADSALYQSKHAGRDRVVLVRLDRERPPKSTATP